MHYLTPAQYRIAEQAALGYSNKQIARTLHLAPGSVNNMLLKIYQQLDMEPQRNQRVILAIMYERGNIICTNPEDYYKTYRCNCALVPA